MPPKSNSTSRKNSKQSPIRQGPQNELRSSSTGAKSSDKVPAEGRHPCGECRASVGKNDEALECDSCALWYHRQCTSVSTQKYSIISVNDGSDDGIQWYCAACRSDDIDKFAALRKTINELSNVVNDLRNDIKATKCFDQDFEKKVINIINEEKEKDKRKENIIVHGLEECSNETEDVETVLELVDSVENVNSAGDVVVEVIRLGKKETGKTRPMKIVFKHGTGMKNKMFKHKESKRLPEKYSHQFCV